AFGGARMAPYRVELRDDRDVRAHVVGLDRGAHTGEPSADDQDVVLALHPVPQATRRAEHTARGLFSVGRLGLEDPERPVGAVELLRPLDPGQRGPEQSNPFAVALQDRTALAARRG